MLATTASKSVSVNSTRTQPAWLNVEVAWEDTQTVIRSLLKSVEQIALTLVEVSKAGFGDPDEVEDVYNSITNVYRRVEEVFENIEALVFDPQPDRIYWAEVRSNQAGLTLQAAPLHIGPLMQEYLWHQKQSVILTSANSHHRGRVRVYSQPPLRRRCV